MYTRSIKKASQTRQIKLLSKERKEFVLDKQKFRLKAPKKNEGVAMYTRSIQRAP